jgi:DNA polymerase (family X)
VSTGDSVDQPQATDAPSNDYDAAHGARTVTAIDSGQIAARLRQAAEILKTQGANPFRVAAYRKAAQTVEQHRVDLRDVFLNKGRRGLAELPAIGVGLAAAIAEMLETGRWAQLDRLRGSLDPASLFCTVPGIGPELAERIHETLEVETLEALEVACHDGRLEHVPGMGKRRVAMVRAAVAEFLGRARPLGQRETGDNEPPIGILLDVDREYRERVAAHDLPMIAPRRFNPEGNAWLPILHTRRGNWHFTALFSNTATAHELGRTRDWVVLYFDSDHHGERQRTVVTEQKGPFAGRRVVRGREPDCLAHYNRAAMSEPA